MMNAVCCSTQTPPQCPDSHFFSCQTSAQMAASGTPKPRHHSIPSWTFGPHHRHSLYRLIPLCVFHSHSSSASRSAVLLISDKCASLFRPTGQSVNIIMLILLNSWYNFHKLCPHQHAVMYYSCCFKLAGIHTGWLFVAGLWVRGNFRDARLYLYMQTCGARFINIGVTP